MSAILELEGLTVTYPGADRPALRGVDLEVDPGEFVVLAGGSAAGKSTLLRAAGGLVPHFTGGTVAGHVRVGGMDTREHGPADLAAVAGSLFQDPETQVVLGTVRAELAFGLEHRGHDAAGIARGVEEAALALGIAGLLDRPTHELSGGELQRVALGAALAGRPRLLLLDEPTSQLDPVAGDELIWLLRRLNEEWGTAVVLAEHRLERCLGAADRVVVLEGGRVGFDGAPQPFLRWAAQADPALQTPGARLLGALGLEPPVGVKQARATLRAHGLTPAQEPVMTAAEAAPRRRRGRHGSPSAVAAEDLWHELPGGAAVLRGVELRLAAGERIALLGRNGAGKSTLLRHLAGLQEPTRGRVRASGRVGLLLQHPLDHLLHERVGDEAPEPARRAAGLAAPADRHPRDLSGGEQQRLALATVLGDGPTELAALLLDEPTRGMDRGAKDALARRLRALAGGDGAPAVLVATHDAEFAADVADRVLLMADGRLIADGPARQVLSGGWYFATQVARILGGAGGALTPEQAMDYLAPPVPEALR